MIVQCLNCLFSYKQEMGVLWEIIQHMLGRFDENRQREK